MKTKANATRLCLPIAAGLALMTASGHAQNVNVTGSLTDVSLGGGVFGYTLTLDNTGPEAIQALWLGWTVGVFDIVNPTSPSSSVGWSPVILGNSVQFGPGTSIAAGGSATFSFDSTSTPADFMAAMAGPSVVYGVNATPFAIENTTLDSEEFTPTVASAPDSSMFGALEGLAVGFMGLCGRKFRG
jgi:hypothetical protein